jgi:tripartite-type tricarboxylate transporter receptor subunit TctC
MKLFKLLTGAAVGCLFATGVAAQDWPTKPVRLINPFPAGGGTDVFLRPVAAIMSDNTKQQFVVENYGGAGGTVGAALAARQPADGYVFLVGAVHHTIAVTLYKTLPYDLQKDFVPVTMLASVPQIIVAHPKTTYKTVAELLDFAKKNPGKVNYSSAGAGTAHHLAGELFKQKTGVDLTHVPYKGAGPAMQDLLAGVPDIMFDGMGTSAPQVKGGKLRAIAVASDKRSPVFPDIPTVEEAGVKDYQVTTWYAIWAVKGTPQAIIDRMYAETVKALQTEQIKKLWAEQGASVGGQSPAEFAKFVDAEVAKWGPVVKASGATIDN